MQKKRKKAKSRKKYSLIIISSQLIAIYQVYGLSPNEILFIMLIIRIAFSPKEL